MIQKDIVLLVIYLALWAYIIGMRRWYLVKPVVVATVFAIAWTYFAQQEYGYNSPMITGFGFNLFPLAGWSLGLSVTYIIFTQLQKLLRLTKWTHKLLLVNMFYVPLLLIAETVAYHSIGIKNLATASFSGLPVCDCLHAPPWMQAAYLAMGMAYMSVVILLGLDVQLDKSTTKSIGNTKVKSS